MPTPFFNSFSLTREIFLTTKDMTKLLFFLFLFSVSTFFIFLLLLTFLFGCSVGFDRFPAFWTIEFFGALVIITLPLAPTLPAVLRLLQKALCVYARFKAYCLRSVILSFSGQAVLM